jgi:XTP/dITP diphosphohydrolase
MIGPVVLATRNQDKKDELAALLAELGIALRTLDEFPGAPDVVEDGDTCEANAVKKATEIMQYTGHIALADDTGLNVEALGGRPGVFAARYAGSDASYEDNWRKVLHEMEGIPWERRNALFLTVAAIAQPGSAVQVVDGTLEGMIAERPVGDNGFGYDPIFFIPSLGKTMAQLSAEEKNKMSHRAIALRKAKAILRAMIEQ